MLDLTKFKVYMVGGYVRDRLLGREGKDHDFVVVGATRQDMVDAGFTQVGADFPVFLHPHLGDEYALARTERKTAAGYNGFETDFNTSITLEQDLERRDLTVNAMAREVIGWDEQGHAKLSDDVIDPYNGQFDLDAGILRHVSEAFVEDPVRVLRVARFAARYGFEVAPETVELMSALVENGELDHLVPERVWTEFEKAMGEEEPTKFFRALKKCGAFNVLFGELDISVIETAYALQRAVQLDINVVHRIALVFSGIPFDEVEPLLVRLKAPSDVVRTTRRMRLLAEVTSADKLANAEEVLDALNKMDAFGNITMIPLVTTMLLCRIDQYVKIDVLMRAYLKAKKISFSSLDRAEQELLSGQSIGVAINDRRLREVESVWHW